MFALDEYGLAHVSDEKTSEIIAVYLESEVHSSCTSAKRAIRTIKQVINSGIPLRYSGNAVFIAIGPEISCLRWMVGKSQDEQLEITTVELLNYVVF